MAIGLCWMLGGLAWAWAEGSLRVPAGEDAAWQHALALTGLDLADATENAAAEVVYLEGEWWLQIRDAEGHVRRASIPAPVDDAARERIARQARSMLANRDQLETAWTVEPPAPDPPPWISPPRFAMPPPPVGEPTLPPPDPTDGLPAQTISYPRALRPEPARGAETAQLPRAKATSRGLINMGAAGVWRPAHFGGAVRVDGARWIFPRVALGGGGSWTATPRIQIPAVYVGAWTSLPGKLGFGSILGASLPWENSTAPIQLRPLIGLDISYGERVQPFLRMKSELVQLNTASGSQQVPLGVWVGVLIRFEP